MVEIGNTHNKPALVDIWFIKLNLTNVVPASYGPNASLLNSIARTLGLHDFYQVGVSELATYARHMLISLVAVELLRGLQRIWRRYVYEAYDLVLLRSCSNHIIRK